MKTFMQNLKKKNTIIIIGVALLFVVTLTTVFVFTRRERVVDTGNINNVQPTAIDQEQPTPTPLPPEITGTEAEPLTSEPHVFTIPPTALGAITITALNTSELGVAVDSTFLIESDQINLTEAHLHSYLSTRSGTSFALESQPNNTFLLRFDDKLANNQIYNLVYSPPGSQPTSFAFQTQDVFRIIEISPYHNTHSVPHDSGIEITFNQELEGGLSSFIESFSIYPYAEGRFYNWGNQFVFVPTALEFGTLYTVTVAPNVTSVLGEIITEEYSFVFYTRWGTATRPPFSLFGNPYETFLPWNEVFIAIHITNDLQYRGFTVDVYRIETPEQFLNFNPRTDTATNHFYSFELELHTTTNADGTFHHLFLDQTLPVGYYVAKISAHQAGVTNIEYKFIQISALSVYSLAVESDMLFWVNDAYTGLPAVGATINIEGRTVTTNSDGIAIINETERHRRAQITIEHDGHLPFSYTQPTFTSSRLIPTRRFLSYMYTDRLTYRPTDTVDVFGVIRPLHGQAHSPDDVITLHIGHMIEIPITLNEYDSFAVRIPVTEMRGHQEIQVRVNGEHLMATWPRFYDYTNLSYVIEMSTDRIAYAYDDIVQVEVSATTFTGIPARGLRFTSSISNTANNISIITNDYGIATGEITARNLLWSGNTSWWPGWSNISFRTTSEGQSSQWVSMPVIVAPRDIMLEHERVNDTTISVRTHNVCVDSLNALSLERHTTIEADMFRGAPVDVDFSITITRHITTRTLRSEHYDRINRRNVRLYDFTTTREVYRVIEARTENGHIIISDLPTSQDPFISFSIEINYFDSHGRATRVWAQSETFFRHPRDGSVIRRFSFNLEPRPNQDPQDWAARWTWRIGETRTISLRELIADVWSHSSFIYLHDGEFANVQDGRMLIVLTREGIISAHVGTPRGIPITFTEAGLSNTMVFGAYFDGQYIFQVLGPSTLGVDYSLQELQIEMEFDQELYAPGDEVTVTIATTDLSGNPVSSLVTISVVDETAIFSHWFTPNFLSRFYRSSWLEPWWTFEFSQFTSHMQHNIFPSGGGAEGGGGDGDGGDGMFRYLFIDNPIFETVRTNEQGIGTLTFTLPHQTTSWRVTALGLTNARTGLVGDSRENIIAYLPFFVELILTNEYIVGDDIAALARVVSSTAGNHTVDFTFEVLQNDVVIFTEQQTAINSTIMNAGKLPIGSYIMRVTAVSGSYRDAVELPFVVAESGLIIPTRIAQQISLDDPTITDLNMRSLPVEVTFTNANARELFAVLNGTINHRSPRTDYMAATAFARHFFGGVWGNQIDEDYDFAANVRFQIGSTRWDSMGAIPQLTYSAPDFLYTVRFAASMPEFVNRNNVIAYFRREMSNATTAHTYAAGLWGLAALGEPVLLHIQNNILALAENPEFHRNNIDGHMHVLYLVAALISLGDDIGAARLMQEYTPTFALYTIPPTERETLNTLMLFINTTLDPQLAWEYINRPESERNTIVSDVLERVNFVRRTHLAGETISEFQYFLNGTTHTVRLENLDRLTLRLTREQYESLNLMPISGITDIAINFYSYDSSNWNNANNTIRIDKSMEMVGYLVRFDFDVSRMRGGEVFTIYHRLPSNMRFVPTRQNHTGDGWVNVQHVERQLVEITIATSIGQTARQVSYYAMIAFDADMCMGTTFISNHHTDNRHAWGRTQ